MGQRFYHSSSNNTSAASRNFKKGARSRRYFQKVGKPEYFWATHPFNAKHPFNIYLCIAILQEAFISIITNFLFIKNTFKIQKNYYNRFLHNLFVTIRLHVKSEGISNTLVTMETDRQQFYTKSPILKVY